MKHQWTKVERTGRFSLASLMLAAALAPTHGWAAAAAAAHDPSQPPAGLVISSLPGTTSSLVSGSGAVTTQGNFSCAEARPLEAIRQFFLARLKDTNVELSDGLQVATARGVITQHVQRYRGVPIEGTFTTGVVRAGQVIFVQHRLVSLSQSFSTLPGISPRRAESLALAGQEGDEAGQAGAKATVLEGQTALVVAFGSSGPALAWRVGVRTQSPFGEHNVYINAQTGALLGSKTTSLDDTTPTANIVAPFNPSCQDDKPEAIGLPFVQWGKGLNTDAAGAISLQAAPSRASVALTSPFLTLVGDDLPTVEDIQLTGIASGSNVQLTGNHASAWDAYVNFHHIRQWAKDRGLSNSEQESWLARNVKVFIDQPNNCNAFYSPGPEELHFFRPFNGCANTATIPFVMHHEYGHSLEFHSGNSGQNTSAVLEGLADVTGMLSTGLTYLSSLNLGCGGKLRDCVNAFTYCPTGCTFNSASEGHAAGQVLCAAWKELADGLVSRYGKTVGLAETHALFLAHLGLISGEPPDTYSAVVQMDVDDNSLVSDGTRHSCEINEAFSSSAPGATQHFPGLSGMVPSQPSLALLHTPPGRLRPESSGPLTLTATLRPHPVCSAKDTISRAEVIYFTAADPNLRHAPLVAVAGEGNLYSAVLSDIAAPASVSYIIAADLGDASFVYPYPRQLPMDRLHPAAWQQVRYADDWAVYHNDFESPDDTAPLAFLGDGASRRSAWSAGPATGLGGDPLAALSGNHLLGANLATAGNVEGGEARTSVVTLPLLDMSFMASAHLSFAHILLNTAKSQIEVNGEVVYTHVPSPDFSRDADWRFENIDITRQAAGLGAVEIRFITQDSGTASGGLTGWNIDDLQVGGERAYTAALTQQATAGLGNIGDMEAPSLIDTRASCAASGDLTAMLGMSGAAALFGARSRRPRRPQERQHGRQDARS